MPSALPIHARVIGCRGAHQAAKHDTHHHALFSLTRSSTDFHRFMTRAAQTAPRRKKKNKATVINISDWVKQRKKANVKCKKPGKPQEITLFPLPSNSRRLGVHRRRILDSSPPPKPVEDSQEGQTEGSNAFPDPEVPDLPGDGDCSPPPKSPKQRCIVCTHYLLNSFTQMRSRTACVHGLWSIAMHIWLSC